MSEEKDEATLALERAGEARDGGQAGNGLPALVPQLVPSAGLPERMAVQRRTARVIGMLHTLPALAQQAIIASLPPDERALAADPARAAEYARAAGEASVTESANGPAGQFDAEQKQADRGEDLTDRLLGRRRHGRPPRQRGGSGA
jgi:phospholipid/cholesterol/gamma-HCH transport system ATP-binding protein